MTTFKIALMFLGMVVLASTLPVVRDGEEKEQNESDSAAYQLKQDVENEELVPLGRRLREILGRSSRYDASSLDSDSSLFPIGQKIPEAIVNTPTELFPDSQLDSDTYETDRNLEKRRVWYKPMH